jgi:hypothetical protein
MEELRGWQACSPTGRLMALAVLRRRLDAYLDEVRVDQDVRDNLRAERPAVQAAALLLIAAYAE